MLGINDCYDDDERSRDVASDTVKSKPQSQLKYFLVHVVHNLNISFTKFGINTISILNNNRLFLKKINKSKMKKGDASETTPGGVDSKTDRSQHSLLLMNIVDEYSSCATYLSFSRGGKY